MERGLARTLSAKGKGKYGKGPMYTVMEEEDWNQWSGDVEQEGDGALALFNHTDGLAGRRSNTFIPSGQPMRVNLGDFIKPKKVFTSKSSDKKDNSKKLQQNRFEILGCLLEDVKVSEEEQQDGDALRNSPDTMLSFEGQHAGQQAPQLELRSQKHCFGRLQGCDWKGDAEESR